MCDVSARALERRRNQRTRRMGFDVWASVRAERRRKMRMVEHALSQLQHISMTRGWRAWQEMTALR
eukprot:5811758-Prymnesium_polylepis.1